MNKVDVLILNGLDQMLTADSRSDASVMVDLMC